MDVLLVDDEESVLDVLSDFLMDCGHQTDRAGNGNEALRRLEESADVDLIITDVRMPQMDGLEFLRAVRVRFPGIPVILITGHGDEDVAVSALQEGATNYLKKPVRLGDLMDCVGQVEERRLLEAQLLEESQSQLRAGFPMGDSCGTGAIDTISVTADLDSLEKLFSSMKVALNSPDAGERPLRARLAFVIDEIPGILQQLRRKMTESTNGRVDIQAN